MVVSAEERIGGEGRKWLCLRKSEAVGRGARPVPNQVGCCPDPADCNQYQSLASTCQISNDSWACLHFALAITDTHHPLVVGCQVGHRQARFIVCSCLVLCPSGLVGLNLTFSCPSTPSSGVLFFFSHQCSCLVLCRAGLVGSGQSTA